MHVVLFFTYDISLNDWKIAGLLDRELRIYKELEKNENIKFTFVTYGDKKDIDIITESNINVVPIYSIFKRPKNIVFRFFKSFFFPFYLKNNIGEFDVIKTNQLHGSWIAIILKNLTGKKLYIRTGFDIYTFAKKRGVNLFKRLFFYLLTKISINKSDFYSVTSLTDKKFLKKEFNPQNEIELIRNWVEPINKNKIRFDNRILLVGRLEKQKNYTELFNEFKNSDYILDVVGTGSLESQLKKIAFKNNIKVNFMGNLNNNHLLELYGEYKIFISASLYEGNPKALLEAMSMGCVVIANRNKNIEEIIKDNINGILFEFSEKNLINKINNILTNNDQFNQISNAGKKYIKENNNFKKILKKELEIYKLLSS